MLWLQSGENPFECGIASHDTAVKPAPAASTFTERSVMYYKYIDYYASVLHQSINTLFRPTRHWKHLVHSCKCFYAFVEILH